MDRRVSVIQNVSTLEYNSGAPGEENSKGSTNGISEEVTAVKKNSAYEIYDTNRFQSANISNIMRLVCFSYEHLLLII